MSLKKSSSYGFTLLEVVVVVALIGGLLLTLTNIHIFTIERSNDTQDSEERLALAQAALNDMQQSIRFSSNVNGAAANFLEIEAEYVADFDDETESIRYELVAGSLIRSVVDGAGTTQSTLLEDITGFRAYTMQVRDSFSRGDYDNPTSFTVSPVDTATDVDYRVRDVVTVDSGNYDSENERLVLEAVASRKSMALTPGMDKQGLTAQIDLIPYMSGQEYQALRYGDPDSAQGAIAIVFESDGTIGIRRTESGSVVAEETATITWVELSNHSVLLGLRDGRAWGVVTRDGASERIGVVGWGSMDSQALTIETAGLLTKGAWDDFFVTYPEIELEIDYRVNGEDHTLVGGATRRATE